MMSLGLVVEECVWCLLCLYIRDKRICSIEEGTGIYVPLYHSQ